MFDAMDAGEVGPLQRQHAVAVKDVGRLVVSQPLDDWKAYLTYHQIHNNAPYLPKADRRRRTSRSSARRWPAASSSASAGSAAWTW
jgi:hypothetical protein